MKIFKNMFCVYTHSHNGKIFYVGKGKGYRPFSSADRHAAWNSVTSSMDSFDVNIVEWFENEKDAYDFERSITLKHKPEANVLNAGKGISASHRQALSVANRGKIMSEEVKDRLRKSLKGRVSPMKGVTMTPAQKRLMSLQRLGKIEITETTTGKKFVSAKHAGRELNIDPTTVCRVLNGENIYAKGFTFERRIIE